MWSFKSQRCFDSKSTYSILGYNYVTRYQRHSATIEGNRKYNKARYLAGISMIHFITHKYLSVFSVFLDYVEYAQWHNHDHCGLMTRIFLLSWNSLSFGQLSLNVFLMSVRFMGFHEVFLYSRFPVIPLTGVIVGTQCPFPELMCNYLLHYLSTDL